LPHAAEQFEQEFCPGAAVVSEPVALEHAAAELRGLAPRSPHVITGTRPCVARWSGAAAGIADPENQGRASSRAALGAGGRPPFGALEA